VAVVGVAPGRYVEALTIGRDLTLAGKCPASVTLVGPLASARGVRIEPGTHVTLTSSSLVDTATTVDGLFGRGIAVQQGAIVDVEDSAIRAAHETGVTAFSDGTRVTLRRSVIADTGPNAGDAFGNGAMAVQGAALTMEDSEIADSFGTGLAIGDASARVARSRIRGNAVGLYVQDGTTLREADAADPAALEVTASSDTVFLANGTKLTTGLVPLPEPSRVLGP
jgi:hypothetical protein